MSREWKPGDVAVIEAPARMVGGDGRANIMTTVRAVRGEDMWTQLDDLNNDFVDTPQCSEWSHARPLVVIDPEDREQGDELRDLIHKHGGVMLLGSVLQAALREFANPTPPKPDEPPLLCAVVQREDGARWVRGEKGWTNLDATGQFLNWSDWSEVNELSPVVRVLSEGVQP